MAETAKNVITTTLNKWSPKLYDSVTNQNGVLYYFKSFGKGDEKRGDKPQGSIATANGGKQIEEDVFLLENPNVGFVAFDETIATDEADVMDEAIFDWKYCYGNAVLFDAKIKMNADTKRRKHKLVKAVIQNAEDTMINKVGESIWNTTDVDGLTGIPQLITDDGTTTTVGGLSTVTYANWANKFQALAAVHTSEELLASMSTLYRKCKRGNKSVDLIVMGDVLYGEYEAALIANKRYKGTSKMADAGFESLMYNGATVLYDENCPANRIYFINTKYMIFNFHKDAMFSVGDMEKQFGQQKYAWPITSMCEFSLRGRRDHGVIVVA